MSARKLIKPKSREAVDFHETLTPVVPFSPAAPSINAVRYGIPDRYLRAGLYLVWILAAVFAGVSIGLLMLGKLRLTPAEAPKPVAGETVKVSGIAVPALIRAASQAQAGSIPTTASGTVIQAASDPDSLQPGFTPYGPVQGKRGTAPVSQ